MAISVYLLVSGMSITGMIVLSTLFAMSGTVVLVMLVHGKAKVEGHLLRVWNWKLSAKLEHSGHSMHVFYSPFVDARYLRPFQAHLQYLSSLREVVAGRLMKPETVVFDGGVLKPWAPDDLEVYLRLFSNEELMSWHDLSIGSLKAARHHVTYSSRPDKVRSFWTYILFNTAGEACGHVEFRVFGSHGRIGEVSFGLLESYRGLGYMSAALPALFSHLRTMLDFETIVARTRRSNTGCRTLLNRLGFVPNDAFEFDWMLGPCDSSNIILTRSARSPSDVET